MYKKNILIGFSCPVLLLTGQLSGLCWRKLQAANGNPHSIFTRGHISNEQPKYS